MLLWKVLCVFAAFSSNAWNNKIFINGGKKMEEEEEVLRKNNHNTHNAIEKSTSVNALEKELQCVAQIHKKFQNSSGCNDVAVLSVTFDGERWKNEALMAVEVANLLTSLWPVKTAAGESIIENDTILFEIARANARFSPSVFGSVVCFEPKLYRNYERFCPYAFRDAKLNGSVHVVDLAQTGDYDYSSSPNAIWWNDIRDKTKNMKLRHRIEVTDFYSIDHGNRTVYQHFTRLLVRYEDGLWTRPYFDCFGGKDWMVTYLAPIFNETNEFLGTASVDISLKYIDINQCDAQDSVGLEEPKATGNKQTRLNTFMGTHRCKKSTKCVPVPFQGFQRGTYRCTCKRGYYFPDTSASRKYFHGKVLEEEYDKMLRGEVNSYEDDFECLACSDGCEECGNDRACVYSIYTSLRYALLVVNCLVILISLVFAVLVYKYWQNKIFKASSPRFLEIIISGAVMMYVEQAKSPGNAIWDKVDFFHKRSANEITI